MGAGAARMVMMSRELGSSNMHAIVNYSLGPSIDKRHDALMR